MFIGPVFTREVVTAPRRWRLYAARAVYVAGLFALVWALWYVLAGTRGTRGVGDLARFGAIIFQFLAPLQLAISIFFGALAAAAAVAHEKDRRTLVLLLLTNLSNSELVLGKLLASILKVLVVVVAALPLFMLIALFGGVSFSQIGRVFAVTLVSTLAAGSLGSLLALWREKTFQTLALTGLVLAFWMGACEVMATGLLGDSWGGVAVDTWAVVASPWRAIIEATRPVGTNQAGLGLLGNPVNAYLIFATAMTVVLNAWAIWRVRAWNPSQQQRERKDDEHSASIFGIEHELKSGTTTQTVVVQKLPARAASRTRPVWDNPIIWREMRTWAYGRKIIVIRLAYWVMCALAALAVLGAVDAGGAGMRFGTIAPLSLLCVLSLLLVNAQAVTSITSERDNRALDLLLVTDLTPREFVFGKLGGILYNTKEMLLLPMLLAAILWWQGAMGLEGFIFFCGGLAAINLFVAMLGVHSGMAYGNSMLAIMVSLGTVFFLFVGVWICMQIMIAFRGDFFRQLPVFIALTIGGGTGLLVAVGANNPSKAIALASYICPFATFYAITSFEVGNPGLVFFSVTATYGFATVAMLIPAIYEFDVATGRTSGGHE